MMMAPVVRLRLLSAKVQHPYRHLTAAYKWSTDGLQALALLVQHAKFDMGLFQVQGSA